MRKSLPTTTSTFRDIIEGGFLYIDKTQYIYELAKESKGGWFLARPRRFGKSLFLSTLEELFHGNRSLFQGLWIDQSDYEWASYPVIRLDFNRSPSTSAAELQSNIKRYLARIAAQYGVSLAEGSYYAQFDDLIFTLAQEQQVVILIDEYDKPLIDNLDNLAEARKIRDTLKGFYGVIKALDRYVRFSFMTGISKFSKVGVFSDLNNLTDLTLNPRFATALGLTEQEIRTDLQAYLQPFAHEEGMSEDEFVGKMRQWYNGFCFAPAAENVYNPFSTLHLFYNQRFANYWFESGSPSFLIKLIHQQNYDLEQLNNLELSELAFSTYEIDQLSIIALLFQSGYLTLKGYDPTTQRYQLDYPNYEVKNAFMSHLLDAFSNMEQGLSEAHLWQLINALQLQDLTRFFNILKVLFANIDYDLHLDYEKYYQTIFYLLFKLMGLRVEAEVKTNAGRIDAVVELPDRIYLFEFKLDKSAESALQQIQNHAYYEKYQLHHKPIVCVGVNFDTGARTVREWETMTINPL